MNIIENLFTRSPFTPLQTHMEKVAQCVEKLEELYEVFSKNEQDKVKTIVEEISEMEHSADITKNDIRNNLPRGLFLAINRANLLEILSLQDTIADKAEDIGVLMTLKKLEPIDNLMDDLKRFLQKNIEAVQQVNSIIRELDELLQSTFGGTEAKRVRQIINDVAYIEHEADLMQHEILKKLYNMDDRLTYSSFSLWMNIIRTIAALGDTSEKLANRISMLLESA
jgi:predicted phosphate transport protein (TIGR00153 family)